MKICKSCAVAKPLTEFYAHKTNLDRLNGKCKSCCVSYTLGRYTATRNYAPRDPETRAKSRAKFRASEKGKAYDRQYAKSEAAKQSRARFAKRQLILHREYLRQYKLDRGCTDCGYNTRAEALDFDHLPGHRKEFRLSDTGGKSWDRLQKEIAKCEVVCANCHRIRTFDRKQQTTCSSPTSSW